eukprot:g31096.t1
MMMMMEEDDAYGPAMMMTFFEDVLADIDDGFNAACSYIQLAFKPHAGRPRIWALLVVSCLLLTMGLGYFFLPNICVAPFGVYLYGADGRNEVRAIYGGLYLALSALLFTKGQDERCGPGIQVVVMTTFLARAFARLIGACIDLVVVRGASVGMSSCFIFLMEVCVAYLTYFASDMSPNHRLLYVRTPTKQRYD